MAKQNIGRNITQAQAILFLPLQILRDYLVFVFPSPITLFPSSITQNWWDLREKACLDVFSSFVSITQFFDFLGMSYGN